jgi:hypothetical protein
MNSDSLEVRYDEVPDGRTRTRIRRLDLNSQGMDWLRATDP